MDYTVLKLAQLAGVSSRTLRYYDEIGLLSPARTSSNGYRVYGQEEVDRLQQILFYRELDVPLEKIGIIMSSKDYDSAEALREHLARLQAKKTQLESLISTVVKTLETLKGEAPMSDKEKFEGFKQKLVEDNEKRYGKEIREKYGDDMIDRSNEKIRNMTQEQYESVEALSRELNETLKAAFEEGDPAGELAQKACELHKAWLCRYWDTYSKEAHIGVAQMYVEDPRFTAYYDDIAVGCAPFLRDAVMIYCS